LTTRQFMMGVTIHAARNSRTGWGEWTNCSFLGEIWSRSHTRCEGRGDHSVSRHTAARKSLRKMQLSEWSGLQLVPAVDVLWIAVSHSARLGTGFAARWQFSEGHCSVAQRHRPCDDAPLSLSRGSDCPCDHQGRVRANCSRTHSTSLAIRSIKCLLSRTHSDAEHP